ncbi:Hypothetical predicted protein [Lecanosticta acicola]|uniref:Uncharacterized protein n=1 Tax=Lecanosticta acicola TaxID=111012 RepID=A0AAI8Z6Z5_9PEZI|nr:Hypothetical predicted protein [Lecanosticta acicola]
MTSVQTLTIERRHTLGTQPADSIALPAQKRHSIGTDWSFRSNRATQRRSKNFSSLTPVPEHANARPSLASGRSFFLSRKASSKQRAQSASTLPSIDEDTLAKPRVRAKSFNVSEVEYTDPSQSSDPQRNRRSSWAKRLSWVPGWTFAGSSGLDAIKESDTSGTTTPFAERRMSRLSSFGNGVGKRLSSFSQAASDFQAAVNEPSHESNFPASFSWPAESGTKMTMPVYGTVDALTPGGMRVLMPCGARHVSFVSKASKNEEILAQDFGSKLKNGDMLCEDAKLGEGSGLATVLRGDMQGFCFHCTVVGLFPMKLLGREEDLPEPYLMDVMVF